MGEFFMKWQKDLVIVGDGTQVDHEGMIIYEGDGLNSDYSLPYFDSTMKTNYTVQVKRYILLPPLYILTQSIYCSSYAKVYDLQN